MAEKQKEGSIQVKLFRGPVDSLSLHEITDYELGIMEKGVANTKLLEFSVIILLLSLLLAASLSLLALEFSLLYLMLIALVIFASCVSLVALVTWKKSNSRSKKLCAKIRTRIPAESMRKSDGRTQIPHIPVRAAS